MISFLFVCIEWPVLCRPRSRAKISQCASMYHNLEHQKSNLKLEYTFGNVFRSIQPPPLRYETYLFLTPRPDSRRAFTIKKCSRRNLKFNSNLVKLKDGGRGEWKPALFLRYRISSRIRQGLVLCCSTLVSEHSMRLSPALWIVWILPEFLIIQSIWYEKYELLRARLRTVLPSDKDRCWVGNSRTISYLNMNRLCYCLCANKGLLWFISFLLEADWRIMELGNLHFDEVGMPCVERTVFIFKFINTGCYKSSLDIILFNPYSRWPGIAVFSSFLLQSRPVRCRRLRAYPFCVLLFYWLTVYTFIVLILARREFASIHNTKIRNRS